MRDNGLTLGIDASNIRAGGGLRHLREILFNAKPMDYGFKKVIVWGGRVLRELPKRDWLEISVHKEVDDGFAKASAWKLRVLPKLARDQVDIIYTPGGTFTDKDIPYVTMARNLLVFDRKERNRYGLSWTWLRLSILYFIQKRSLNRASGVIYLTRHNMNAVERHLTNRVSLAKIIPHGVSSEFRMAPRRQKRIDECTDKAPFRILYVSIIDMYKHQWKVAEVICEVRKCFPVELNLVGPAYRPAFKRLAKVMETHDPNGAVIKYHGGVDSQRLKEHYRQADLFVFASTCETISIIILEAMSAGLPIVSTNAAPMTELLGESAYYFDINTPETMKEAIERLIVNQKEREKLASGAYAASAKYTWKRCADETFAFLKEVHSNSLS